MKNIKTVCTLTLVLLCFSVNAQKLFYVSGDIGYAGTQGDAFKDKTTGEKLGSFGLGFGADAMMCLDALNNKFAVGGMFAGSVLFGFESSTELDVGLYSLAVYGLKAQYRLRVPEKKVSPYVTIGLGLSQFSTPDTYYGETLIAEGGSAYSFGIRPEIGFDLGSFILSAAYIVPMHYTVKSQTGNFSGTAGVYTISLGWRQYFSFNDGFSLSRTLRTGKSGASEVTFDNAPKQKNTAKNNKETYSAPKNTAPSQQYQNTETQGTATQNVAEKTRKVPQNNAESVKVPTNPAEAKVTYENPNFKVGEKVLYKFRDRVYTAHVVSFIGNDIAVVETEDGLTVNRYVKDLVTAEEPPKPVAQAPAPKVQMMPQYNAESVKEPTNPAEAKVTYENPNFKVGEKVLYKFRDRVCTATIISFIGSDIALVEMENGATVKRYLKDLVKVIE